MGPHLPDPSNHCENGGGLGGGLLNCTGGGCSIVEKYISATI